MMKALLHPYLQKAPFHLPPSRQIFMAPSSKPKTLTDYFPHKRLKSTAATGDDDGSAYSVAPLSAGGGGGGGAEERSSRDGISDEQRRRMELKKSLAKVKLNLRICSEKVLKSKAEGSNGFVKLEELLVEDSWLGALSGEFEKPYVKNLTKFVETEICGGRQPIYPPQHLIFNALNSTPFDKVKTVILGQDPYHGPGQAMGLAFSVPEGVKIPSSLVNIFKELKQDLGCSIPPHGNLERWTVQGVLLLNTVLTVRHHQANSHAKKGWEQFTDSVIRTISEKKKGVVFLLWGNSAQEKSRLIDGTKHHILKSAHPSGLSANRGFFGCRHFSKTNQILEQIGESPIDWQL